MPTQEERLATLESFRTETLFAYKDMAMELAMVKGLISDAIGRLAVLQRDISEVRAELYIVKETLQEHTGLLHLVLSRLPPAKE